MNDMLLTPEATEAERVEALDAWKRTDKTTPWETWWNRWLCRAQVQKVMDEYQKAMDAPTVRGILCPCDACRTRRFIEALEAAGVRS